MIMEITRRNKFKMPEYYTDSLVHHGIKGQKWGIRRYQKIDGSYTAEGNLRRLGHTSEIHVEKKPRYEFGDEDRSKGLNAASNAANKLADATGRFKKKDTTDYSHLSNKELQDRITRMNLERQYSKLTGADTNRGQELAGNILRTAGDVLAAAASVAAIYEIVRRAKGG